MFLLAFGPDRSNIALIFSVIICPGQFEHKKQRTVHGQGASNINYLTIVFNFDLWRLS